MLFALQPVPLVAPEKFEARTVVEMTVDAISAIAAVTKMDRFVMSFFMFRM